LQQLAADPYSAGAAVEALVKVLRWDAASLGLDDLQALAVLEDPLQVPWIVDDAEEATSGRVVVREGRSWPVNAGELRNHAVAELRRREQDGPAHDQAAGRRSGE
jgi:hypothetical protein